MMDMHCHLDLYSAPHEVTRECARRRLYILSVTTVPSAFEGTAALAPAGGRIRTAIGLHPQLVGGRAHELPQFEALLPQTRYVGEVGLDGSRDHRDTFDLQRGVLEDLLRICARAGGRIITVHSRGATAAVLDALAAHPSAGTFILHWYLGTPQQVLRAKEMGCWFSVNPAMFSSRRGKAAVAAMPKDRVLPESDGPFGIVGGRPAYPWEAWTVVPRLAELWGEAPTEVASRMVGGLKTITGSGK
jgi:TatD DNase family protein